MSTYDQPRTFADDIEREAASDIEAIVIGKFGWGGGYGETDDNRLPADRLGVVLTWAEARPLLDYAYDTGYGAPDCHAITAWTATHVIWVHEYDGSTSLQSAPRNPVPHEPEMS